MSHELATVRRELGALIERRNHSPLAPGDARRYEDLCRRERGLLGYTVTMTRLVARS